ncbi:hypothetical protein NEUTE1DRAFT_106154 [Neurospora tetrasperma FGSC 2508]|uniref:Uncharacterized protein n=1 Tax=Neurospora tetrasperma (strain FGSC 2508 / ATCC MYA-4615 / P0657) TaxID=510951 RepID=F8N200_NEUT8|nr:uncharacterized protein NEUTE1DRAFT_106154 [Neurospora tetrasperma FGSC 2508]EGO53224.1 hypothetical protein NEUTE1DRAFT_106154 [Neurospora tetrasperma FGSC 2508]
MTPGRLVDDFKTPSLLSYTVAPATGTDLARFDSPLSRMLACAHHVWKLKYAIARPAPLMYNHSLVAGCRGDEAPDCHVLSNIASCNTLLAYLTLRLDKMSLAHQALKSVGWPTHHGHLFDSSMTQHRGYSTRRARWYGGWRCQGRSNLHDWRGRIAQAASAGQDIVSSTELQYRDCMAAASYTNNGKALALTKT